MTLVEVVAGIALLGTLLVLILTAHSRVTKQSVRTRQRLGAIRALDHLLVSLETKTMRLSDTRSSAIPDHPDFLWKAESIPNSENEIFGTRQVRISIAFSKNLSEELTSVDLVVPDERIGSTNNARQ